MRRALLPAQAGGDRTQPREYKAAKVRGMLTAVGHFPSTPWKASCESLALPALGTGESHTLICSRESLGTCRHCSALPDTLGRMGSFPGRMLPHSEQTGWQLQPLQHCGRAEHHHLQHTGLDPSQSNLRILVITCMPLNHLPALMSPRGEAGRPWEGLSHSSSKGNSLHVFPEQLGPPRSLQLPLQA